MGINYKDHNIIKVLEWIQDRIKEGKDKEFFSNPMAKEEMTLLDFLKVMNVSAQWNVSEEEFKQLVDKEFKDHEERMEYIEIDSQTVILETGEDNNLKAPQDRTSSWMKYRKVLENKGFNKDSIDKIESDSEKVLQKISKNTENSSSIKGLVVGSVQSGKTTNMAALMAMSADYGWNVFIVLTGMIDNLRIQTQERLFGELSQTNGTVNWDIIENPTMDGSTTRIPQKLDFANNNYMIVSLKQKDRLSNLIEWLNSDKNKRRQMKILVIDDEADQASVNTSDLEYEERKTINDLIVKLVNGLDLEGNKLIPGYKAMNYVAYTATPYANVLSESVSESLYPRDFIALLSQSPNYIGPQQIFGVEGDEKYPGLDIVRILDKKNRDEYSDISALHLGRSISLSEGLKDSLSYFIAASASLRKHEFNKPVSMLVHTSVMKDHHENVASAIKHWLKSSKEEVMDRIENIWNYECKSFTVDHFKEFMPLYEGNVNNSYQPHDFDDIKPEIEELLSEISPIQSPKKGQFKYHNGIHLSVDNSAYNKIVNESDYYRLVYPDDKKDLEKTPVFLTIGGATLSRGLTLEGLIATYFFRNSGQADTLMQMGRWFGYRLGYELYPRIWMTANSQSQFTYLAELDYELRNEIKQHVALGKTPSDVGIKIKNAPRAVNLKVTSANKSRGAIESDYDFTGASIQTTTFDNDDDTMRHNLKLLSNFIDSLEQPIILNNENSQSVYWENIPFHTVKQFLLDYKFNARLRMGNNIDAFIEWVETKTNESLLENWNVIAIGRGEINQPTNNWKQKYFSWNKVERSRQINDRINDIRIQSLRGPADMYKDIDSSKIKDLELKKIVDKSHSSNYLYVREKLGLEKVPQIMLYRIDKDSKAPKNSKTRQDMNSNYDLVGIYISIPGGQKNKDYATHLVVSLDKNAVDLEKKDTDNL